MVVRFIVFLTLSTLICRSTDISKCFSESLRIRDNESRLYVVLIFFKENDIMDYQKTILLYFRGEEKVLINFCKIKKFYMEL